MKILWICNGSESIADWIKIPIISFAQKLVMANPWLVGGLTWKMGKKNITFMHKVKQNWVGDVANQKQFWCQQINQIIDC